MLKLGTPEFRLCWKKNNIFVFNSINYLYHSVVIFGCYNCGIRYKHKSIYAMSKNPLKVKWQKRETKKRKRDIHGECIERFVLSDYWIYYNLASINYVI